MTIGSDLVFLSIKKTISLPLSIQLEDVRESNSIRCHQRISNLENITTFEETIGAHWTAATDIRLKKDSELYLNPIKRSMSLRMELSKNFQLNPNRNT
jgi:hypothetical protein